ncbi:MAG: hypothetical protein NC310_03955 [Roseburia sp.]|nr:hypothetical protein [Anaeroplasma bactoclasticum]MCM1196214.1 hypothetical protein [Roseburia sp.]MCM1556019.1 hypothetical protein [Anaeroplasma bactoclasticum]
MRKFNLGKRIVKRKKIRLENKIAKIQDKIQVLKKVDDVLSKITLENLALPNQPLKKAALEERLLYKLQSQLMKLKKAYQNELEKEKLELQALNNLKMALEGVTVKDQALVIAKEDQYLEKRINKINQLLKLYGEESIFLVEAKIKGIPTSLDLEKSSLDSKKLEKLLFELEAYYKKKVEKVYALKQEKKYRRAYEKNVYKTKVSIARLLHQNKVKKDMLWWNCLSKEEKKERRTDASFYIVDSIGYWLTLLSVAAEILYLILLLSVMVRTYWVGITILVNIAFLLLLFTMAIKIKNYKKAFSYISILFGLYCILRISYIIHGLMGVDLNTIPTVKLIFIYGSNAYMIFISIFVGIRSYFKIKHQIAYLSENKITQFQLSK